MPSFNRWVIWQRDPILDIINRKLDRIEKALAALSLDPALLAKLEAAKIELQDDSRRLADEAKET